MAISRIQIDRPTQKSCERAILGWTRNSGLMPEAIRLDHLAIVLHRPRFSENIGAAARAACNMGVSRLIVVDPRRYELERVLSLSTHAAGDLVDRIEIASDLKSALSPFGYVVGTTARVGNQRKGLLSPREMAERIIPISAENHVAFVFGPEDRGLTNDDLTLCHGLVHIPTADFSSINLAQSVMIVAYELFQARRDEKSPAVPRLATRHELDGMYDQLRDILARIHYINPEHPDYWMSRIRRFCTRMELRAAEVSIIRGICRQINWYARKNYEAGLAAGKTEKELPPCD